MDFPNDGVEVEPVCHSRAIRDVYDVGERVCDSHQVSPLDRIRKLLHLLPEQPNTKLSQGVRHVVRGKRFAWKIERLVEVENLRKYLAESSDRNPRVRARVGEHLGVVLKSENDHQARWRDVDVQGELLGNAAVVGAVEFAPHRCEGNRCAHGRAPGPSLLSAAPVHKSTLPQPRAGSRKAMAHLTMCHKVACRQWQVPRRGGPGPMLGRYTSDAMAAIWSDASRYSRWREVELAVLAARVRCGDAPLSALEAASAVPSPANARVEEIESRVRHDVVAFLDAWTADMDDVTASHIHRGLTSSDIVDTAQAKALNAASNLILAAGRRLVLALIDRAVEHRATLSVARTHGQPAAFDVLGHRFADLAFAADRALARLVHTVPSVAVANISGPVGTGIGLPADLVADIASSLGLGVAPTTTQVLFRDSIAAWVGDLALLGAVCEAVATDIRIGQHDGIVELAEAHHAGQEGSSAMPHKRNPITAENITGLARVLRGYVGPALEDVTLWGHRDLSHSSVERIVLPDAAAVAEQILTSAARAVEGVVVDLNAVRHNVERAGTVLASSRQLAKAQATGLRRSEAAAQVRDQLRIGGVSTLEVEEAAEEVLQSTSLTWTFERVAELREKWLHQLV